MAKLTDTLDSPDSGKRIVSPAPVASSFLGGLAGGVSDLTKAWAVGDARQSQQDQTDVLNSLATNVQKMRSQAEDQFRGGAGVVTPGGGNENILPPDLATARASIDKTQTAVNQGRATQDALDLKMEQFVSDMQAKHPEQAAAISDYMKQNGYDHYMFRQGDYQNAAENSEQAAVQSGRAEVITAATTMGFQGTPDYLYQKGTELKQQALLAEQLKAAHELAQSDAKEGRESAKWSQDQATQAASKLYTAKISADVGSVMDHVNSVIQMSGDDANSFAELQKIGGLTQQWGSTYLTHLTNDMARNGVLPKDQEPILAEARHQIDAINSVISGPTSRLGQTQKALTYFQTTMNLNASQALPYFSWLKSTFGSQGAVDSVFGAGGAPVLSKELTDKVAGEIKNFDPTKPNTGFQILKEIGALSAGDKNLADMPEGSVTGDHVRGLVAAVKGNAKSILDPEADNPAEFKGFLGSYGNLTIATQSIQPGYKDINGWGFAVENLTGQDSTAAMEKVLNTKGPYRSQALATFQLGRASVGRLLEVGRSVVDPPAGQGIKVVNGQFVAFNNNANPKVNGLGGAPGFLPGAPMMANTVDGPKAQPSAALQRQAADMNKAVSFLVNTAQMDPSLKGYSAEELRQHYLTGNKLSDKGEGGSTQALPDFNKSAAALETELNQHISSLPTDHKLLVSNSVTPAVALNTFSEFGKAGSAGIVGNLMHESGLNTGANGDSGLAVSLAQWHPDRAALAAKNGFDLSDPQQAMGFVKWEMQNGDAGARKAGQLIKNAKTATEAADIFAQYFLRPEGAQTGDPNKINSIAQRRSLAQHYYDSQG